MPVITLNKDHFCDLLGKEKSIDFIEENLSMLGVSWEGRNEEEFSIEINPNRPDMLSIEGLVRAFKAFINLNPGLKKYKLRKKDYLVKVNSKVGEVRPYIVNAVIKGVEFTDEFIQSIMQLQEKLHISHCRKRKKASIGLHDLDKIKFPVNYTTKPKDFKFIPLEGERKMTLTQVLKKTPKGRKYGWILENKKEYPMLIDSEDKVLSFPPIINSKDTKVEKNTKNLFIDITALDEKTALECLNILVATFADRGGKIYSVRIEYPNRSIETPKLREKKKTIDKSYINKLLGLKLKSKEIIKCLNKMGHGAKGKRRIKVKIPCYRTDIMHPIDIAEEVAIGYRYDKFEPEIPNISTIGKEKEIEVFSRKIRELMVGLGFQEVMCLTLTNKKTLFEKMNTKERNIAEISNPKTEEYTVCRDRIIPSLLEILSHNKHVKFPQKIFEVEDVIVLDKKKGNKSKNLKKLGAIMTDYEIGYSDIRAIVDAFLRNLNIKPEIKPTKNSSFIQGRVGDILINKDKIGIIGEINPKVLTAFDLETPTVGFEINVKNLYDYI